jgi:hypothetical protein
MTREIERGGEAVDDFLNDGQRNGLYLSEQAPSALVSQGLSRTVLSEA